MHASIVLVQSLRGIPLVKDPNKPKPNFWKIPGGKSEYGETPPQTAWRELREETGIVVPVESLKLIWQEERSNHTLYCFFVETGMLEELAARGDEGEEIRLFSQDEINRMGQELLRGHRVI